MLDCQWLQQLLSYGLLQAAFSPHDRFCALRELKRIRSRTLRNQGRRVQHMQKAKLARLFYALLTCGHEYVDQGRLYCQERYGQRLIHNIQRKANKLGMSLIASA